MAFDDSAKETARLAALDQYRIMDTEREREYDDIVRIAAEICGTSMALISLVDDTRQWFKAAVGLSAPETPRGIAFCAHAIQQSGVFLVQDASRDPRFEHNPLVTSDPNPRFYAGAPLETPDGHALGTLCVLDSTPKVLSEPQQRALQALSRQVMTLLELRRVNQALRTQIDARDRAETQLEIQAQRTQEFSKTWNLSPDLWCVLDSNGYFERSNPAWTTTLGWSAEQMRTTPFSDLIHPDDLTRTHAAWATAMSGLPVLRFENRYRCKSGDYRWLSRVAVPEEGKVHCNARDVTEEKAQAQELITQRLERDLLWETTPDLLVTLTFDGIIQRVNPAWTTLLGHQPEELVGHHVHEFVRPEDFKLHERALADAAGEPLVNLENRQRHKDGSFRWFSWVSNPRGQTIYATGVTSPR